MSSTVQINISNKMSSSVSADPAFDMKLDTSTPVMTAGTVSITPLPTIGSLNAIDNTGGGAYTGTGSSGFPVRGVVAYSIPGAKATLIIYFDTTKCRIDTLSPGVTITTDIVDATAKKNQVEITGTLVAGRNVYTYTVNTDPFNSSSLRTEYLSRPRLRRRLSPTPTSAS
ncbi:hypothetical protein B0H15DRAFT_868211 [Mycena belliarum]|uniref:Uncharacterized protein n=1 Tax=Mycena belliarum TaxID=1033014 RepID=A0AAD6XJ28_9AGAR|nr:hypothetical protein B0H15DRAFT_868211 [Mycena belliae]